MARALAAALMLLAAAAGARAEKLAGAPTDAEKQEAWNALASKNGAGCMSERQFYDAFHKVGGTTLAWNPRNPVSWYLGRNTYGLLESLLIEGYGELSRLWSAKVEGTDFDALARPCAAAEAPRALAHCVNNAVRAHFAAHPDQHPLVGGGDCKMYAAGLVAVASRLPAVTKQAAIISGPGHAINELSVRDGAGVEHRFWVDSLHNLVVSQADDDGKCGEEGALKPGRDWSGVGSRIEKISAAASVSP